MIPKSCRLFGQDHAQNQRSMHFSIRLGVARVCEISSAFVFGNLFEKGGDGVPQLFDSARLHFAQERFESGEKLFDGIEIRAVSRQENGACAAGLDCFFDPVDLMSGNIVKKDDLTLLQSWSKNLFDIGQEMWSVHRAIQRKRGGDAIIAQPAYESRCFPVAMRHLINEPYALRSPAIKAGHLGGGGGLIDEDKLLRIKGLLLFPPGPTGRRDLGPVLFGGVHALFFKGQVEVVEEPRNCRLAHRHLFFRQAISKLRKRTIRLFRYKFLNQIGMWFKRERLVPAEFVRTDTAGFTLTLNESATRTQHQLCK